jgi:acyl-CoA thioesterase-1
MAARYGARAALAQTPRLFAWLVAVLACLPLPAVAANPVRLLTFGDSLTAGYGLPHDEGFEAQLQKALDQAGLHVTVLDGGVSGDTSAGGLARLDWVLADKPDVAIVELGANDGLRGLNPDDLEKNLTAILDRLQAARIPVLLTGMYAPPNLGQPYEQAFRAVFDRLGKRPGVMYDPFFLQGVAADPGLNQADGIHPNAEGVRRIVARLLPMVKTLVGEAGGG